MRRAVLKKASSSSLVRRNAERFAGTLNRSNGQGGSPIRFLLTLENVLGRPSTIQLVIVTNSPDGFRSKDV